MGDGTGRYRYQQDRVESALVGFCDYGLGRRGLVSLEKRNSVVYNR
jgi:hypothetical protein